MATSSFSPIQFLAQLPHVSPRQLLLFALLVLPPVFLLAFYFYVTPTILFDRRRLHLPPGPRGLPFIGSYLTLNRDPEHIRTLAQSWTKTYGHVFYTRVGGSDYIWLSSPHAVKDLMDTKGAIYSSRPPAPLAQDVASAGRRQLWMAYGPRYRVVRKIAHSLLNINITTTYQPVQDLESKQLMFDLLGSPEHFYDHNRRYSASVITTITYGKRIGTWDDPLAKKIYAVMANMQQYASPGQWLVDSFPSLQYLPQQLLGNWRSFGEKVHREDSKHYLDLWETLKKEVQEGKAKNCFCKDFYESGPEKVGLDNLQAAYQAGGLVEAGSETTSAFLNTVLMFVTKNPRVLRRAQEELDRVVPLGEGRLPTWMDEEKLPYIRAMIKETLRMRPPNKVGIHHATVEDDWYEGMFIPKGSVVVLNWWAINFDEERYQSPFEFMPERYLGHPLPAAAYLNVTDPYDRDHVSYGAGRRVCPGVHIAEKSLFLNISRLLWGYDVIKKVDEHGKEIEVDDSMVPGWLSIPNPFECDIRVRSERHEEIIRETWKEAEKGLAKS